jgi:hypothetical protein
MREARTTCVIIALATILQSCASLQGVRSTELNQKDLAELFMYRELAMDDAKLLKAKLGPSIPEAEARSKYQAVQTAFNSTLTVLQTSITAGNDPKDYQAPIRAQLDTIKARTQELDTYTQEKTKAKGRAIVSEAIEGVAKGIVAIWKGYREVLKETREAVIAQLEKQRMPPFEKI